MAGPELVVLFIRNTEVLGRLFNSVSGLATRPEELPEGGIDGLISQDRKVCKIPLPSY